MRGGNVVCQLLGPFGTDDHAGDLRLREQPCQCDLRHRDVACKQGQSCTTTLSRGIDDRREPAKNHPLRIKRHFCAHCLHARVFHHFLVGGITHLLGRILNPRETHNFAFLSFHCTFEVCDLAVGHIVAPAFDNTGCAKLLEHRCSLGRVLAENFFVLSGHSENKSIDVTHIQLLLWINS